MQRGLDGIHSNVSYCLCRTRWIETTKEGNFSKTACFKLLHIDYWKDISLDCKPILPIMLTAQLRGKCTEVLGMHHIELSGICDHKHLVLLVLYLWI